MCLGGLYGWEVTIYQCQLIHEIMGQCTSPYCLADWQLRCETVLSYLTAGGTYCFGRYIEVYLLPAVL